MKKFKETKLGKLFETKLGSIVKGLVVEGLQALPVIGTIVTNIKTDTRENPKGKINLGMSEGYRIVLGLVIAALMAKGILSEGQINIVLSIMGMN